MLRQEVKYPRQRIRGRIHACESESPEVQIERNDARQDGEINKPDSRHLRNQLLVRQLVRVSRGRVRLDCI